MQVFVGVGYTVGVPSLPGDKKPSLHHYTQLISPSSQGENTRGVNNKRVVVG